MISYDLVAIVESQTEPGEAWSSHSTPLKKLGIFIGDMITFEAKAAKKSTMNPAPYKINNPSQNSEGKNLRIS